MAFQLEIVSIDGKKFSGEAERLSLRTQSGDIAIMAKHTNYCTGVGMGTARVTLEDGTVRKAACIGGMLTMIANKCRLLPSSFEWAEDIDVERAKESQRKAEAALENDKLLPDDVEREKSRLLRAKIRLQTVAAEGSR